MQWKTENGRIYSVDDKGELMAEVTFVNINSNEVNINHVYVNPILRGKGVAGEAMKVVVDYLRSNKLKAIATCPYAKGWFEKNKDLCKDVMLIKMDM